MRGEPHGNRIAPCVKVVKIGGSLLTRRHVLQTISRIFEREYERNCKLILVVSAMKGVTDSLIRAFECKDGKALDEAISKYAEEAHELGLNRIISFFEFIREDLRKFLGVNEPWVREYVIVHGELLSALLIEAILRDLLGLNAKATYDPGITTDDRLGMPNVIEDLTIRRMRELYGLLMSKHDIVVVPGFIGITKSGRYTSLGRGGSDYTASLIASYLSASLLVFYTDSSGLLSADPTLIPDPILVRRVGFEEAYKASLLGVKKFHPRTFEPLLKSRIKTLITSPWVNEGTIINDVKIETPKFVCLKERDGIYVIAVIGYGVHRRIEDIRKIVEGDRRIIAEEDVVFIHSRDREEALELLRKLHEWVKDELSRTLL